MTTKAGVRRGARDSKKEAFWRKTIGVQRRSGLCVRAWCRGHGLRESSFHWWRRELVRRDGESRQEPAHEPRALTLVPVHVTTDPSTTGEFDSSAWNGSPGRIEIVLTNQGRVRLTGPVDRQALADVLAVLTSATFLDAESSSC